MPSGRNSADTRSGPNRSKATPRSALGAVAAAVLAGGFPVEKATAEDIIYVPGLVYRTGPYAPGGVPSANGLHDYFTMINERDGGVNGVKLKFDECETGYNTKVGVECYEKLKANNPVIFFPYSTGITYQLIPKTPVDKIPVLSMGYGRTSAADGRVFPWVFNFPTTYWSQASVIINYIGAQEEGMGNLPHLP